MWGECMSLKTFLDNWAKTHPVAEPAPEQNEVEDWLINGGESPLPMWPRLDKNDDA